MMYSSSSLFAILAVLGVSLCGVACQTTEPTAPALDYLYTAYVTCTPALYRSAGPRGVRTAIPIVGGNFTGPKMSGKAEPSHFMADLLSSPWRRE